MHKKRPCLECRRWFQPNPRVGDRQRTCGSAECSRARHRRKDRDWHARNPSYDRARRWQNALQKARESDQITPPWQPPLAGVPWEVAQDAIGVQATVIIAKVSEVLVSGAQAAMERQPIVFTRQSGGHRGGRPQDEIARGSP